MSVRLSVLVIERCMTVRAVRAILVVSTPGFTLLVDKLVASGSRGLKTQSTVEVLRRSVDKLAGAAAVKNSTYSSTTRPTDRQTDRLADRL